MPYTIMAPITAATAKLAYDKAAANLKRACTGLERQIPPSDSGEEDETPPLVPRARGNSVAACALCAAELEETAPGDRQGHVCQHAPHGRGADDVDRGSNAGSEGQNRQRKGRSVQPMAGVVKEYLTVLDRVVRSSDKTAPLGGFLRFTK